MSYQEQTYSWIFSSNPLLGAQSVSPDGSTFSTYLQEPFQLPSNAFGIEVGCIQAAVWFTQYNITDLNNKFRFTATAPAGTREITIPNGLYSFDALNNTLRGLLLANFNISNYTLVAVQATQKVSEAFAASGAGGPIILQTVWSLGTFQNVLGFSPTRVTNNPPLTNNTYPGDFVARFNLIDFYIIQSSLVSRGIRTGNSFRQVVAQVPINDVPGALILYEPVNVQWTAAPELGNSACISQVTTILADSDGNPVDTQKEPYSVTLQVKWRVPLY